MAAQAVVEAALHERHERGHCLRRCEPIDLVVEWNALVQGHRACPRAEFAQRRFRRWRCDIVGRFGTRTRYRLRSSGADREVGDLRGRRERADDDDREHGDDVVASTPVGLRLVHGLARLVSAQAFLGLAVSGRCGCHCFLRSTPAASAGASRRSELYPSDYRRAGGIERVVPGQ